MDIDFTRFFVDQNQKASHPYGPANRLKAEGEPSPSGHEIISIP